MERFWDLGQGRWDDDGAQETETQVSPRVQVEFTYLHYLIFFVYMCVCACSCFSFCFSVSTGELKYGDVCDTFMHVKKALSSSAVCRAGSAFPPSESVSWEGNSFPKWKSLNVAVYVNRVLHARKKAFERIRWKCLSKKREKSENHILFLQNDL